MTKTKFAAWLRKIADRLSPVRDYAVYPTKGEVQYEGDTYKLRVLKNRKYLPPFIDNVDPQYRQNIIKELRKEIAFGAILSVEYTHVRDNRIGDEDDYVEGRLLILTKKC